MDNYNVWLYSDITQMVFKTIKADMEELKNLITNGSHIQEKSTEKISLDYTYSLGQLDGMRAALETIEDIKSIIEEDNDN